MATSPSFIRITLWVWAAMGVASLATKYSPSPTPTTSGLPSRAAMRVRGSSGEKTQIP